MGKVLIKCIQTPMQKYFYDRSLDSVVMVNDEEYQILKTVEKTKLVPDGVLRRFVKSGLLRETAIEEIEHPETENLHLLAEHYMGNLILQVTQQCNLIVLLVLHQILKIYIDFIRKKSCLKQGQ